MRNEQIDSFNNNGTSTKMPIKKVFTILGIGLSLSIILLNGVAFVSLEFFKRFMPQIFYSDYFALGISTIPLIVIALPVFFAITNLIPTVKTNYRSNISFKNLLKIFASSYAFMTILNLISNILNIIISSVTGAKATNPLSIIQSTSIWPTILFAVILSPIAEEIIFRYIIINKLRGYGSGVAIFTSAFAFGLYHGNLYQMLYAFAMGLILGAILYKTGKLRYTIILHIAINFVGGILPLLITSENGFLSAVSSIIVIGIIITGFVFGIITLCRADYSRLKHDIMPSKYLKPFFLNIGMISFIIIIGYLVVKNLIG